MKLEIALQWLELAKEQEEEARHLYGEVSKELTRQCDLSNAWVAENPNEKFYLGDPAWQHMIDDLCDATLDVYNQLIDAEYTLSKAAADAEKGLVFVYCDGKSS